MKKLVLVLGLAVAMGAAPEAASLHGAVRVASVSVAKAVAHTAKAVAKAAVKVAKHL